MSRDVGDPNERIRLRLGRRPPQTPDSEQAKVLATENASDPTTQNVIEGNTPTTEPASMPASQVVEQLSNQPLNSPDSQVLNVAALQQPDMLEVQQVNTGTTLPSDNLDDTPADKVDSQGVNGPTHRQAKRQKRKHANKLTGEPATVLAVSLTSKSTSQQVSEPTAIKKKDREQQAVYLSPEQRMLLKFLAPLENRELSDIVADALDLYFEQSPYKQVLQMILQAQQQHEIDH